ncbi:MAG: hypothetical protein IPJ57_20760 [Gemmatimonadetes bacterium]|nr:hypothetical protein [Gemmatimonadota bacterium]
MTECHLLLSADWSITPAKRRMAIASRRGDGSYLVGAPEAVGPLDTLLPRIEHRAGPGAAILIGLDHPIGVPLAWARQTGVSASRRSGRSWPSWARGSGRGSSR